MIKTEKEWLKLPKNTPLENISLNDPNVHPRLIHKDGSICHSKTYWKSLNKNPPLREFELPDLFSDDEGPKTENDDNGELTSSTTVSTRKTQKTSSEPEEASFADKLTYHKRSRKTNSKTGSISTQRKDLVNEVPPCVNTEKTNATNGTDPSKDTQTSTSTNTRIDVVISYETNLHRRIKTIDVNTAEVARVRYTGSSKTLTESFVNTEHNCVRDKPTQERPNTANITEPEKSKAVDDADVAKRK